MRPALVLGIALAVLSSGCSKPEPNIVGEWRKDNGLDRSASKTSIISEQLKLVFKPDRTYTMGQLVEGTYAVDGHTVTLTISKENGIALPKGTEPLNQPINYTLSDDGKLLTTNRERNPMKFVRVAAGGS